MKLKLSPIKTTTRSEAARSLKRFVGAASIMSGLLLATSCGGGSSSGDIETWLVEVGNDFPDAAKCVAEEMSAYSVSDFEGSFDGEVNEPFDSELDAAYEKCEDGLGITSD